MNIQITPLDSSAVNRGTRATYRGVTLLIARSNNNAFKEAFRRLSRPYQDDMDNDRLDEATQELILCRSLAEGVLVGWDASTFIFEGEELPYSVENAEQLLRNDPDCREFVLNFAGDVDNFLLADSEKIAGKSLTT